MRYEVIGEDRLYIAKRFYEPGDVIEIDESLPNERSLIDAGHIRAVPAEESPTVDLDKLTVPKLRKVAADRAVDLGTLTEKSDIVAAPRAAGGEG